MSGDRTDASKAASTPRTYRRPFLQKLESFANVS
jgi:hypothetical protein